MFRLPQHGRSVRQYRSGVMEAVTRHSDRLVSQGAWPLAALDKPAGQRRAQHVQHLSCAEAPVAGVLARERPALPSEGLQCLIKQLGMTSGEDFRMLSCFTGSHHVAQVGTPLEVDLKLCQ